ncbi:hypothetical protein VTK26DRAFT_3962 [Humicola hyalothermophila]
MVRCKVLHQRPFHDWNSPFIPPYVHIRPESTSSPIVYLVYSRSCSVTEPTEFFDMHAPQSSRRRIMQLS